MNVLPAGKLQIKPLESPNYVIAGEEYQSRFAITNQGNTEYTVSLKFNSTQDLPYTVDAEKFTLVPGQSKIVTAKVETNDNIIKKFNHQLKLTAECSEDSGLKTTAKSKSSVDILPKTSGVADRFHRIPTELTLRYVSEDNQNSSSGFQTELRGKGTLDEEGKKHVEFRFRGPDIEDKSIFGQRDEYYLNYWTEDYRLYFGDRSYSLSSLTENYLYGRGLEGRLNIDDDLQVGAYHMRTRWLNPQTEETAVYMDYLINDKNKVGINYLRKIRGGETHSITSFEGDLEPFKDTHVQLEYAIGPSGDKKDKNAYLAWVNGRHEHLSYYLKLTHAGPDYPGYYSDLDYISGGLAIPVNKRLRLNASFRREENNLDENPAFYSAPLEKYYQAGADYRLDNDTIISFDWLSRDRQDQLINPEFNYLENTFRLGANRSFDKFNIHGSLEVGQTKNNLTNKTSDTERYTASAYFRPNKKQSYRGYLSYDTESDFTGENKRNTTIGLNAKYNLSKRTSLNFALQTNSFQSSAHGDRDNIEMRLNHTFKNDNKISLVGRHTRYRNSDIENDTTYMVQYTIPLGLPTSIKKSVGSIKGYLYDSETQNAIGQGLLRLNALTAVTDNNGNFTFPSVKPGVCYLNIDTASIGLNKICTQKTPIELIVQGGDTTFTNIAITRAARLTGQIMVYRIENGNNKTNEKSYYILGSGQSQTDGVYGLANTFVELKNKNSSEIRRTITDKKGRFELDEVRPGKWTLKISSDNLPKYHYLEKDTFNIELAPGQEKQISAKVLPKKRRIQIIAEPQTLLEEKQK